MAQRHSLDASARTILGKETKKLRRDGVVPGVVYGPVVPEPIAVSVDMRELDRMYHAFGSNLLIDLKLNGSHHTVYMRRVTIDRVARKPLHAEFYAPNLRVASAASIPILFHGEPAEERGVITPALHAIDVRGLPDQLPPAIEVDISILAEIDQAIFVRDITFPEGVELLTDPDELIVKLSAPAIDIEEELEAEAEEAELAEGEEVEEEALGEDEAPQAETGADDES